MTPVRLGAVGYLNAKPLVEGLDREPDRFSVRFDAPSRCATLLHQGAIDVGMIPSIEYLRGPEYRIVPAVALASRGPVASVALFSSCPIGKVRSIAADDSSRTSVGLLQVLCRHRFGISPRMVTMPPDLDAMLKRADAALVIGDPALFLDHRALGLSKVDLGEAWTDMTGLPFVWAFWAGRPGVLTTADVAALQAAKAAGVAAVDRIADACCRTAERAAIGRTYLREHMRFDLGPDEQAGLSRYYELAVGEGLAAAVRALTFF
jgi:chorismate dehydratase